MGDDDKLKSRFIHRPKLLKGKEDLLLARLKEIHSDLDPNRTREAVTVSETAPSEATTLPLDASDTIPSAKTADLSLSPAKVIETPAERTRFIIRTIGQAFSVAPADLVARENTGTQKKQTAKYAAAYVLKKITGKSWPEAGRIYGKRDHSTMMYLYSKAEDEMKSDGAFKRTVQEIEEKIKQRYPEKRRGTL